MSKEITRRTFCKAVGAGVAVIGLPGCGAPSHGLGHDGTGAVADMATEADLLTEATADLMPGACSGIANAINAGAASALMSGQAKHFKGVGMGYFLVRDAKGLYALTDVCPHEGCAVAYRSATKQFVCPCHASRFDQNGGLLQGPAVLPLDHYAVCVDENGNAIIDEDNTVDPSTRA